MPVLKGLFLTLLITGLIGGSLYYSFYQTTNPPDDYFFEVETPFRKNIQQEITATGKLKLKNKVKVGSGVAGRVKAIHVSEYEYVKEGQLLVEVDTGLGDTEVREAEGALEKAFAEQEYYEASYHRKKQLFDEQFLADVELQEAKRNHLAAIADVKTLQASYERRLIEYRNRNVYAPTAGVIIQIIVSQGEKVTSDLDGGELLSLVPDIKKIEVELNINEKDIGQIFVGQEVEMVVDAYPNRIFKSTIEKVDFAAKNEEDDCDCVYQAKTYIENPQLLLRPGMNVTATVTIAKRESALAITSRSFMIKKENLEGVASLLNIPLKPLGDEEKLALEQRNPSEKFSYIWVASPDCFKEVPIQVGISDQISFEVKSGLKGDEKLIVDVMEEDEMEKIYSQFYRKL